MKTRKVELQPVYDLNTQAAVDQFRKASEAFAKREMSTREDAMRTLIAMGIYTKSGKISKNYSR